MNSVVCAICRNHIHGEINGNQLLSASKRKQESGAFAADVRAISVRGVWICPGHPEKPLDVSVGVSVVTRDDERLSGVHESTFIVKKVTKVRPNGGFSIGETAYNVFGIRLRGYGEYHVQRIATAEDVLRYEGILAANNAKREAQEKAAKELDNELNEVIKVFRSVFPIDISDCAVHVTKNPSTTGNQYEISVYVSARHVAEMKEGRSS